MDPFWNSLSQRERWKHSLKFFWEILAKQVGGGLSRLVELQSWGYSRIGHDLLKGRGRLDGPNGNICYTQVRVSSSHAWLWRSGWAPLSFLKHIVIKRIDVKVDINLVIKRFDVKVDVATVSPVEENLKIGTTFAQMVNLMVWCFLCIDWLRRGLRFSR